MKYEEQFKTNKQQNDSMEDIEMFLHGIIETIYEDNLEKSLVRSLLPKNPSHKILFLQWILQHADTVTPESILTQAQHLRFDHRTLSNTVQKNSSSDICQAS